MRKDPKSQLDGFLPIDKPAGITSHDVVDRLRFVTRIRRIGHSGTLDPFATGLLFCGVGAATKYLGALITLPKTYHATMHLGATSTTGDPTGTLTPMSNTQVPISNLNETLGRFRGAIEQIPPMYSAKKVGGKKLYTLARAGKTIPRQSRQVTIHHLALLHYQWPTAELEARCSSGTYIRTLVEDIGAALGLGAYTEALRRTAIGSLGVGDAVRLDELTAQNWQALLLAGDQALDKIGDLPYPSPTYGTHPRRTERIPASGNAPAAQ